MSKSIFKFLDPYTKEDKNSFFGRELETEDLYQMCHDSRLLLVYGASGTGKTSLIQCGLSNRFGNTRWKEIFVRRGDHLMASLERAIEQEITAFAYPGMTIERDPIRAIAQLERLIFTPVFLIFDQFEELFILSKEEQERQDFFGFLKAIYAPDNPSNCRAILSIREEFIAFLWPYEKIVPALFEYRYRIEKMREEQVQGVVEKILQLPGIQAEAGTAKAIIEKLGMRSNTIELTYLQVYLDRLYHQAAQGSSNGKVLLNNQLVEDLGEIEDVIGVFLDDEIKKLEAKFPAERRYLPLELLGGLVSDEKTKKVLTQEQFDALVKDIGLSEAELDLCLKTFDRMKILRHYES